MGTMLSLNEALGNITAEKVASLCLTERTGAVSGTETQIAQTAHRIEILKAWLEASKSAGHDIEADIIGQQTLDIGCGQGDMTALFASVLKAQGDQNSRVIGVDPARPDYGSPFTLGQAQEHLSSGPLSDHLSFVQALAPEVVSSEAFGTYSTALFTHCLYYLPSYAALVATLEALRKSGVTTLLLAEWSLSISRPAALPHLLAVLLQSVDPIPEGNVRTVLSPKAYIRAAKEAGWETVASKIITPAADVEDGKWEVYAARDIVNTRSLDEATTGQDERSDEAVKIEALRAHIAAMESSIPDGKVNDVAPMDVWTAVFRPA